MGTDPPQGLYLNRIAEHGKTGTKCLASSEIRSHNPSVSAIHDLASFRARADRGSLIYAVLFLSVGLYV
jgi:hypothetical protein